MKKILFFALAFLISYGIHAQELEADDFVVITQQDAAYPGFNAKTYRGLFPVGHGQFKMFNYGGTPGNLTALGANETLGSFVFNGYDGTKNVISAVIQAKTITDSKDPRFNFLLSNGVGNQRPNRMTIIGQTGHVGIGVTDPTSMLHIKGAGTVLTLESTNGQGYIDFKDQTGVKSTIEMQDDDFVLGTTANTEPGDVFLRTNGQNRMVVDADGNVGIGTVTPGVSLDVLSLSSNGNIATFSSGGSSDSYVAFNNNAGYVGYIGNYLNDDYMDLGTDASNTTGGVNLVSNGLPRLTVAADGYVGIGTVNPELPLHVIGTDFSMAEVNSNKDTGTSFNVKNTSVGGKSWGIISTGTNSVEGDGRFLIKDFDNDEVRLTVAADGDIGIGTINPVHALDIETDSTSTNRAINATVNYEGNSDVRAISATSVPADGFGYGGFFTGGFYGSRSHANGGAYTGSGYGAYGVATGTAGTRYGVYGLASGGTTNYAGYFAGDATVTGTFNNPSDARLKKNVKDYENALEIINQLEAKTYEFKNSEYEQMGLPTGNQIGFIAQELEEVLPSLVKNNVHPEVTGEDEAGNRIIVKEAVEYKGVNYMSLIPVLTEGIKELSTTVEEKEETIEALAKDNADMKTELSAMTKKMNEMAAMLENMNDKFNQMEEDMSSCCLSGIDERMGSVNTNVELNSADVPSLEQNSPNPFYEQTIIKYYIPSVARTATMTITDIKGSPIKSVNLEGTGLGTVTINANELPVGTYVYTLFVDGRQVESKQMILVK